MTNCFASLCATKSRLKITRGLTDMFRCVLDRTRLPGAALGDAGTLLAVVQLASNGGCGELGVGGGTVLQAVAEATGRSAARLKADYASLGDLGDVAHKARSSIRTLVKPSALTVLGVKQTLQQIAAASGPGCTARKKAMIHKMLVACSGEEARFLVRTVLRNLRTGAVGMTILAALAVAVGEHRGDGDPAADPDAVRLCFSQHPCFETLVPALVAGGVPGMQARCRVTAGVPIQPMLAKLCGDLGEVVLGLGGKRFCADYKYDGQRAQVHLRRGGEVTIFSRHLETMTEQYPDAAEALRLAVAGSGGWVSSCIVDAEVVAVDRETDGILPFQLLQSRPRKGVALESITTHVKLLLFDLMSLNGVSLLSRSLEQRAQLLRAAFEPVQARFGFVQRKVFEPGADGTHDVAELREFLHAAFRERCEGLMVKELGQPLAPLDAAMFDDVMVPADRRPEALAGGVAAASGLAGARLASASAEYQCEYLPAKRCTNWLKVKKDYIEGLADTLDVVPIAAWRGNGRKAKWYSPFLCAVFDPETEELQALCKVMSGFTDALYAELKAFYDDGRSFAAKKAYYVAGEQMRPHVWLEPCQVWEIKGAELTVSPVHKAAVGQLPDNPGAGLSLRFPRYLRRRDDKTMQDATTPATLLEMLAKQRDPSRALGHAADGDGEGI